MSNTDNAQMTTQTLETLIKGMDSSSCATVIEQSLKEIDGVLKAKVSYPDEKMWVEFDTQKIERTDIEDQIHQLGYQIPLNKFESHLEENHEIYISLTAALLLLVGFLGYQIDLNKFQSHLEENHEIYISLTAGLLLLVGFLGELFFGFPSYLSIGLYLGAYLLGGWDVTRHALHALKERQFDTDVLMVFAAVGAAFLGEFAEGALLLFLFSLGHALENRALNRARSAISALGSLTPKSALVRRDEEEKEVPVKSLQLEDIVIIRPGERIPVDGTILSGTSGIDQSSVTGE